MRPTHNDLSSAELQANWFSTQSGDIPARSPINAYNQGKGLYKMNMPWGGNLGEQDRILPTTVDSLALDHLFRFLPSAKYIHPSKGSQESHPTAVSIQSPKSHLHFMNSYTKCKPVPAGKKAARWNPLSTVAGVQIFSICAYVKRYKLFAPNMSSGIATE